VIASPVGVITDPAIADQTFCCEMHPSFEDVRGRGSWHRRALAAPGLCAPRVLLFESPDCLTEGQDPGKYACKGAAFSAA